MSATPSSRSIRALGPIYALCRKSLVLAAAGLVAACGGGGSSGGSSSVTPPPPPTTYTVGGAVSGLTSSGLVLQDNGGNNLTVAPNATSFTFSTSLASGAAYAVSVLTQPSSPAQVCTVAGGSGTVASANVTSVSITCTTPGSNSFKVGGTVAGLTSNGLVLQVNGGGNLSIAANATTFQFPTPIATGKTYAVTVLTQPSNPAQVCTVAKGSGTVGTINVTTVAITCTPPVYKVGGSISGLTSNGLVLQDNAGDNLTVPANATTFTFLTALQTGKPYAVTVLTQPSAPAEVCTVTNGSGTVASSNITSITVSCVRVGQFVFVVNETGGTNGTGDVTAFAINPANGTLSVVGTSALGANDTFPVAIAVDQTGHAYVTNAGPADNVAFFDIAGNGALSLHSDIVTQGTSGTVLALSPSNPSGQYLYVGGSSTANANNGSVSGFTEDPTSGDLTGANGTPYAAETPLSGIAVDPTTQFVFAASSSHDWIIAYTIGSVSGGSAGSLTQLANSPFSTLQGSVGGLVVSPLGSVAGGFAYATNSSTASVSALSYDNNGNVSVITGSPYLSGNQPEGLAIDPTGKYLYVANYQDGTVTSFSINAQSGALTLIGTVNTGNITPVTGTPGPTGLQVDPSGQFLYVANKLDGSVSLFTTKAGTLTLGPTYPSDSGAIAVGIE